MPPQRTFPPVKPLKTERTHEENQERAYIAASRRSDRSLEARVESARRASEIHKRRTGRSLRVTEQDVINEEMYEEEDDDIPSQYRRLTAHLQTGSAEFNRRLQTYLANHVAMRTALNDAIHNNFSQHYPNAPSFAHNSGMYPPSAVSAQGYPQMDPVRSPMAPSPHSPHTPHAYRSAPYSVPSKQGYRGQQQQQQQQQSSSGPLLMRTQHAMRPPMPGSNPPTPGGERPFEIRRMSMPIIKAERPEFQSPQKPASPYSDSAEHADSRSDSGLVPTKSTDVKREPSANAETYSGEHQQQSMQQRSRPGNLPNFPPSNPYSPFSMALPMESQQMINQAALPQNDFGAALMAGSENWMFDAGLGASNAGEMLKPDSNFYPNTIGMNSTLLSDYPSAAPAVTVADNTDATGLSAAAQGLDFGQFLDFSGSNSSNAASGAGTPADDPQAWKELIDPSWVDGPGIA